jgi:hypothetical protein
MLTIILFIVVGWLNITALIWNGRLKASLAELEDSQALNGSGLRQLIDQYKEIFNEQEQVNSKLTELYKLHKNSPRSK